METSSENRIYKLISGAGQGLVGAIGGRVLGLAGNVFAARILGPAVFGIYAIGWTLLRFFSIIAPLGTEKGVLQFAPKYFEKDDKSHKGLILQALGISSISGITFGVILFYLAPWLAEEIYHKPDLTAVFRYFSFVFPPIVLLAVISATTRTTQRVGYSVLLQDLGQPFLGLILMIVFYFMGLNLFGVVFADVLSISMAAVIGLFILAKLFPNMFNKQIKPVFPGKNLLRFSIPASLAAAFVVYIFWIDRLLIGYFRTSYENGIYQAASQISMLFSVVLAGINLVVIPMFADAHHKQDRETLQEVYCIATKWGIYFSIPALVVLFVSPKEVLSFLYGTHYSGGAEALIILLLGQFLNLLTGSVNPLIVMTGNQNFLFRLSGVILIFDIAMNMILIPKFGLLGAAISTAFSLGGLFLIALVWAKINLGLWPYDKRYLKGFFAAVLSIVAVILVKGSLPNAGLDLLFQGVAAVVIFGVSLFVQKLDKEDMTFVLQIWKKISGKT